jgi:hypothetical protein
MFSGRPTPQTKQFTHNVGPEAEVLLLKITDGDLKESHSSELHVVRTQLEFL